MYSGCARIDQVEHVPLNIRFSSDGSITSSGFVLGWACASDECDVPEPGKTFFVKNQNFGQKYKFKIAQNRNFGRKSQLMVSNICYFLIAFITPKYSKFQ